ncbi:hypothetical protein CKF54_02090 [Psittacicella hinzii]|uniref:Transposase n=1 Tax=Psittacicella hinzii TaxID=2028575 RepID=A0A3A1Y994_9GAMM|nr:hypothetical protein [Psittacicella hinzii]RIY33768.1 hypothetical protein CKF54_02090 [Psittacicella hinzii]
MTKRKEVVYIAKVPESRIKRKYTDYSLYYVTKYRSEKRSDGTRYGTSDRVRIGKMLPENTEYFLPNKRTKEFLPDLELIPLEEILGEGATTVALKKPGRPRKEEQTQECPVESEKIITLISDIIKIPTAQHFAISQLIAEEIGLVDKLSKYFSVKDTNALIALGSLFHHETKAIDTFTDWSEVNNLPLDCFVKSQDAVKFFKRLSKHVIDFKKDWANFKYNKEHPLIYDVTSYNYRSSTPDNYSILLPYNSQEDNGSHISFCLVTDKETGLPLNFDLSYENENTSLLQSEINQMLAHASTEKVSVVYDAKYAPLDAIEKLNIPDLTILIREKTETLKDCVEQTQGVIKEQGKFILEDSTYTIKLPVTYDESTYNAYLCFSPDLYSEEFSLESKRVKTIIEKVNDGSIKSLEEIKQYDNFVDINCLNGENKPLDYKASFSNPKFRENTKYCGYFVVLDNNNKEIEEGLQDYHRHKLFEAMCQVDQFIFGNKVCDKSYKSIYVGRSLSIFVSLVIRNELSKRIKKHKYPLKMTVNDVIDELNNINIYKSLNGSFTVDFINEKQEEILKALGITNDQFADRIKKICSISQ